MVLAAGFGTRLRELGREVPKVLLPVNGRPLLARQLDLLADAGVKRVVVNTHHLADQIQEFVRAYRGPLEVHCSFELRLLGTAGAVRKALPYLEPAPFLVVYGDIIVSEPLRPLIAAHAHARPAATLAVHEERSAEGKGVVTVDALDRVTEFIEKGKEGTGAFLVNSGIYVLETSMVAALPEGVALDFGHDVIPGTLAAGESIMVHRLTRPVIDIGTEEGLARARALPD